MPASDHRTRTHKPKKKKKKERPSETHRQHRITSRRNPQTSTPPPPTPSSPSTTAAGDVDHHRFQSPPLLCDSSRRCLHRPRATTAVDPQRRRLHRAAAVFTEPLLSLEDVAFDFSGFLFCIQSVLLVCVLGLLFSFFKSCISFSPAVYFIILQ